MDLKIGKINRLRLESVDYNNLKLHGFIKSDFSIGSNLALSIEVKLSMLENISSLICIGNSLIFNLSSNDFKQIAEPENIKQGLMINNFVIQVDLWNENKRLKNTNQI